MKFGWIFPKKGKWLSVILGKKIQTTFLVWIFSRNDAYSFPEKYFFQKFKTIYPGKSGFFLQKWRFLISKKAIFGILAGFFSKNDAYSFPGFWIFLQDSRIGVNFSKFSHAEDLSLGVKTIIFCSIYV